MEKMDLLIKGGKVFNTYLKKFMVADMVIAGGRIFYVGDASSLDFDYQEVIAAEGRYIIPGLIDIHMHIESSMATPEAFAAAVIKNGVTTIVSEPHEMANVFGLVGIKEMIKAGTGAAVDIYYAAPSSVPSTSAEFETTGAEIEIADFNELMQNERVICLGEVMNCYDIIHGPDTKTSQLLDFFRKKYSALPIEGHCSRVSGLDLAKVLWAGVSSDHTQQTVASLAEKIGAGMFLEIQEKSLNRENIACIAENQFYEDIALVTDDVMADKLISEGHLNHLVKKAVSLGMPIEYAIYCATYTPARRMRFMDRGSLAPGKLGDLIILDDLSLFTINSVYKRGALVYRADKSGADPVKVKKFPKRFYHSIMRQRISAKDLQIKAKVVEGMVKCRIISVQDGTTSTDERIAEIDVRDGYLDWEGSPYCLVAVLERYGRNGNIGLGLITGDTIKRGAVAASYCHDHHNIIVVGKNAADMVMAVNVLIESQGGYFAVENGQLLAGLTLPIGGILSDKDMNTIGRELAGVTAAMRTLGYKHYNPVMSLSTNGLPVSPLLKITDRGLIRFDQNKIVDIFVEE